MLVLAAAVGAVAFLLLGEREDGTYDRETERAEEGDWLPPELRGLSPEEQAKWRARQARARARERTEPEPQEPAVRAATFLAGQVVAAETGLPLPGAKVWLTLHRDACPRLEATPSRIASTHPEAPPPAPWSFQQTSADGRFAFVGATERLPAPGTLDLCALAEGRVLHVECRPVLAVDLVLRLEKGLALVGRVADRLGRPIEGAFVDARPGPETPATPGHGWADTPVRTDEDGQFELGGLVPGDLLLHVDHPRFMPKIEGPHDPAGTTEVDITLTPALRATFLLRTDDGRAPEHPTLVWRTEEEPPRVQVLMLPLAPAVVSGERQAPTGELVGGPVRLPCDSSAVVLQVRADGYATWSSESIRLPAEGGEETFQVTLTGDLSTGRARIALEDDTREKLSFIKADPDVVVMRLDPGLPPSTYVLQEREDLLITDLPAGRYLIRMTSASFAPAETEIVVHPGQETETVVSVRPPARVRIRFVGPEPATVRFRLTQGGDPVLGVPVGTYARGKDEETGEPILAAGREGLLLSGLAAGTYTVEVLSKELTAPATLVRLTEGDTEEVEIQVARR